MEDKASTRIEEGLDFQRLHVVAKDHAVGEGEKGSRRARGAFVPNDAGGQIPMPPPPADGKYDVAYFTPWLEALQADWDAKKPSPLDDSSFVQVLDAVESAGGARQAAEHLLDKLQKRQDPPVSKEVLDQAKALLKAEDETLEKCLSLLQSVASPILETLEVVSTSFDDSNLITLFVLQSATLEELEKWCSLGHSETQLVIGFLQDVPFMKRVVEAGGPYSFKKLGRALQTYNKLTETQDLSNPVLERLALAVALELCVDLVMFGYKDKFVDPLQRYIHYSQAYLLGELDPAFSSLSVWEMRMVVDCNAPDEQIGWGRQSLQNYRPDICYSNDAKGRYCNIVHTDVTYTEPDFYKPIHTYDQILSGGGKCGPRAWYGRFACKCFGIPTWGVRQPGHAAMTRWTCLGHWVTNLGWGADVSTWNDRGTKERGGLDFFLEVDARYACCSCKHTYQEKVQRIEWLAFLENESDQCIRQKTPIPDKNSPWYALSMMQRRVLSEKQLAEKRVFHAPYKQLQTKLETVLAQPDIDSSASWDCVGRWVIPAASFTSSDKADVMKSFLGGRQVFLHEDGHAKYEIPEDVLQSTVRGGTFQLSIRLCTVHRKELPLKLTVTDRQGTECTIDVPIPYTMGYWQDSDPINLPPDAKHLHIARTKQFAGITYKELLLIAQ